MNFKLATIIDQYWGKPLLYALSLLPTYPKKKIEKSRIKSILVIKFWGIGSILLAGPLLHNLKKEFPDVPIDFLSFQENREFIQHLKFIRNVYTINLKNGLFSFIIETLGIIKKCRKIYSLIIDLEFFAGYSALMTKLLAAEYSLGFESLYKVRNLYYSRTVIFDHSTHVRLVFLKFLSALGIGDDFEDKLIPPNISENIQETLVQKFPMLNENKIKIAININTGELSANRLWPFEYFQKLVLLLKENTKGIKIFLVGGKGDISFVNSFYDSLPEKKDIFNIAGKLDLLEFSWAMTKMTCLITNDSGPLHIAEAIGTPTACFFGPETPNLYGPVSPKSIVFYKNLYCSPCLNTYSHKKSKCKDNKCLKSISPEYVYEQLNKKILLK